MARNEFYKENRKTNNIKVIGNLRNCALKLDALSRVVKKEKEFSTGAKNELCILLSNYSSAIKTVLYRYLNCSGLSKREIGGMSTTEAFAAFSRELKRNENSPVFISSKLHLVALDLRNRLSHSSDQIEYLTNVIERSGVHPVADLLARISREAKDIYIAAEIKLENHLQRTSSQEANREQKQESSLPFGISLH